MMLTNAFPRPWRIQGLNLEINRKSNIWGSWGCIFPNLCTHTHSDPIHPFTCGASFWLELLFWKQCVAND